MEQPGDEVEPVTLRSVWELIKGMASSWNRINAPRLGASLSFYTMLSMAPLLVLCIGLAGLVFGREAAEGQIAAQLRDMIGPEGGAAVQSLLKNAAQPASGIAATVLGLVTLLFGASGVFVELHDSLNVVWGAGSNSSSGLTGIIRYRFFSFAMVLGIGFLLLVSLLLSAAISAAEKYFGAWIPLPGAVLHLVNLAISILSVTVLFGLIYKVVPDARVEWRDVWIGAGVTSLLFSAGKFLIGLYLGKASVGSAYGAAGSLVVFLVWVYYSAQIFFLGAEFTRAFAERHGSRARAKTAEVDAPPAAPERPREPKLA